MKGLKILLFFAITLIINWTAYSKSSTPDSLKIIEVVRWRVERLIQDAYKLRALEEYVVRLEQETISSNDLIIYQDSLLITRSIIIETQQKEIVTWKDRYTNQKQITREERKGKRRWRIVAIVATGLFVWVAVSQ